MQYKVFKDGIAILGDVTSYETFCFVRSICNSFDLIGADPPYFDTVKEKWDSVAHIFGSFDNNSEKVAVDWMVRWSLQWCELLEQGGSLYTYGCKGQVFGQKDNDIIFRPFFLYPSALERASNRELSMRNLITWDKKRAYGTKTNYLTTAEYLAYFVRGYEPKTFNIPLLETDRGYEGYNKKYPAKSPKLRRKDTFSDIFTETEILRGKTHECEKPAKLSDILVNVHCNPGDVVLDLFAGSGSLSKAARRANCFWVAIEYTPKEYEKICEAMKETD